MEPQDLAHFRALPKAEQKAVDDVGLKQWTEWEKANAASFPDTGGMVGKTKRVTKDGISDAQNVFCGYVVSRPRASMPRRASSRTIHTHDLPGDARSSHRL